MAVYLKYSIPQDKSPIVVYGHKNPYMIVAFFACVKAGHPYCPVDISNPDTRTEQIIQSVRPHIILATESYTFSTNIKVCALEEMILTFHKESKEFNYNVDLQDTFYIIFTSGSTGTPKGVQITAECLENFLKWSSSLTDRYTKQTDQLTFINQAPFSFDLSVMDLYTSLYMGGTLWVLDKKTQTDTALLLESLEKSKADIWVSTPSFADICLADPKFNKEILSKLKLFFFCGEVLTNSTVSKLQKRFPETAVLNTYGPTESTVAVTEIEVTKKLCEEVSPLPVGKVKPGTEIRIMDKNRNSLPDGEKGEIVILGNTVSTGYYGQPELTGKVFGHENGVRWYRTGDEGYFKEGLLYYLGRIDLQIKLHGYRIEIEDIENNLLKLEEIERAVVLPVYKDGKIRNLKAVIIAKEGINGNFETTQYLRNRLKEFIPDYMIPKKFIYVNSFPMTNNGKVDRKELGRIIS